MFAPESNWSIPEIFPKFADDERIAIDLETYDPHLLTQVQDGLRIVVMW